MQSDQISFSLRQQLQIHMAAYHVCVEKKGIDEWNLGLRVAAVWFGMSEEAIGGRDILVLVRERVSYSWVPAYGCVQMHMHIYMQKAVALAFMCAG